MYGEGTVDDFVYPWLKLKQDTISETLDGENDNYLLDMR